LFVTWCSGHRVVQLPPSIGSCWPLPVKAQLPSASRPPLHLHRGGSRGHCSLPPPPPPEGGSSDAILTPDKSPKNSAAAR
jgi:hypothetical protein